MPALRFSASAITAACTFLTIVLLDGCAATNSTLRSASVASGEQSLTSPENYADGEGDAEPVDPLEQRTAIIPPPRPDTEGANAADAITVAPGTWIERGPSPTQGAQVAVPPDNEVSGAVHAIAAHPSNANILYAGSVNGGIWRTNDATAAKPTWVPQTDQLPSQSIGALAFDPLDATSNTLLAGTGRWSNFGQRGDDEIGLYRTTNGGVSWTVLGAPTLVGQKMIAVAARGPLLYAASTTGGLYRSVNTGNNFTLASGTGGLPAGGMFDLVGTAATPTRLYAAVRGTAPTVFRSDDSGTTWTNVTAGIGGLGSNTNALRLSVGAGGVVYAAVVNSSVLAAVARSVDLGVTWTAMDVPAVHPGSQGATNTAIVADPANANVVYISGDRISASPFTGNVQRGNASLPLGSQFTITHGSGGGGTSPHADSRAMAFDANGNLLQSDDGGIYRRTSPSTSSGTWGSVIGNLSVSETHDLDYDRVANVILIGTQDNGMHQQASASNPTWNWINSGDGGDAAIDDRTLVGAGSYRYLSSQNLGGLRRVRYNAANTQVANTSLFTISDPQFVTPMEVNVADSTRMLIGGTNAIYESNDITTAAPSRVSLGTPGANRNAMAYGSLVDPEAAYVGKNAAVYKRVGAVFVVTTALPAGANTITDVAMDPNNPLRVYAIDDNQVFRSQDGGATWVDVTGNLPSISSNDYRTIEYISDPAGDKVALGTRSGVFVANALSSSWLLLGLGLPDVLVFDLRYIPSQHLLIAGTLGRGVWSFAVGDRLFANGFDS
ncbi:MAG: hypothetical protein ABIR16_08885 [Dokdonella sp.]